MDEILIGSTAWFILVGWMRGFTRSLFDALSWLMTILFITVTVPYLQDQLFDSGWRSLLFGDQGAGRSIVSWAQTEGDGVLITMAGTQPMSAKTAFLLANWYLTVLLCALSLFVGFQMIWNVLEVTKPTGLLTNRSRYAGGITGLFLGIAVLTYAVQFMGTFSWVLKKEGIDQMLAHSVILHSILNLFPW